MKTTLHTVLCVTIRLGAVLMAVGIVQQTPAIFLYSSQAGEVAVGAILLAGAGLLAAFALWLWPNILAWWAISRSQHETLESPIDASQLQHVAFSVAGAWLFISGTTGCLARLMMMMVVFRRAAYGESTMFFSAGDWYWLVEHLATALAGAWLALGSRGLVGLLHRLRGDPVSADMATDADAGVAKDG